MTPMKDANALSPAPSIRRRLSRALLAWSVVCGLAVSAAVGLAVQEEVDELLDDALRASAEVLSGLLAPHADGLWAAGGNAEPSPRGAAGPDERFAWQLIGADRQVLARSLRAPAEPFRAVVPTGFADAPPWRLFGTPLGANGRMLIVAQSHEERAEAKFEAGLSAVLAALAVGLLGYLWLHAKVRQELAPLLTLSNRLAQHEPLAADVTLGPAEREELQPMHLAIDELGRRLALRLAHERAFTAHAAHALRTPLAGIDAQLAIALREATPATQARLARVREAAGRLQRVVDALLTLFRSGAQLQRQSVNLAALLERLPVSGLEVDVQAKQAVSADPDLLAAALLNLLDNAVRYGATRVVVTTPAADTVRLHDDGPGVTAQRRQALQAALSAQGYEGQTGMGLMLADVVARAHDGRLVLPEVAQSAGFVAELRLAGAGP